MLLSASPSMVGGNRGLWSLRVPLEHLGALVYPDMFSPVQAPAQLTADGQLVSSSLHERLAATLTRSSTSSRPPGTTRVRARRGWSSSAAPNPGDEPGGVGRGQARPHRHGRSAGVLAGKLAQLTAAPTSSRAAQAVIARA